MIAQRIVVSPRMRTLHLALHGVIETKDSHILGPFHLFNAINLAKATKNASALWIRTCLVICFVINSLHGDQDEPVMQFMIPNTI